MAASASTRRRPRRPSRRRSPSPRRSARRRARDPGPEDAEDAQGPGGDHGRRDPRRRPPRRRRGRPRRLRPSPPRRPGSRRLPPSRPSWSTPTCRPRRTTANCSRSSGSQTKDHLRSRSRWTRQLPEATARRRLVRAGRRLGGRVERKPGLDPLGSNPQDRIHGRGRLHRARRSAGDKPVNPSPPRRRRSPSTAPSRTSPQGPSSPPRSRRSCSSRSRGRQVGPDRSRRRQYANGGGR